MIPCLGSNQSIALSDNQRVNVKLMAAKQQYLTNSYTVKLENAHIMHLDAEVKNMTLRKYLMSRAPKTSVIQRLFVSAEKSWKGNTFTLVTVKPYAAEAVKALNCMIPEYLHYYGEVAVQAWFSNAGLLAYKTSIRTRRNKRRPHIKTMQPKHWSKRTFSKSGPIGKWKRPFCNHKPTETNAKHNNKVTRWKTY
jgi:hypothetical protein